MAINITTDWLEILKDEFEKDYYLKLRQFLINEYKTQTIYPPMNEIFSALNYTSYKDTKVLILGQDPYHGEGQAHGLSFSVKPGVKTPYTFKKNVLAQRRILRNWNGPECTMAARTLLASRKRGSVRRGCIMGHLRCQSITIQFFKFVWCF